MWVCCEQPCAPRLKFRTPNRHVVLVDVCGRQDELRDIVKRDQTQFRVGVQRRGERSRRVLAHVEDREAVLLRFTGCVLHFALGRHRSRNVEDDHQLDGRLRGRRVAFDLDEGGVFDALDDAQGEAVLLLWCWWQQRRRVRRRRWGGQREGLAGQPWRFVCHVFLLMCRVFCACLHRVCSVFCSVLRFWRLPGGFGKILQGQASSDAVLVSRRGLGTAGRGGFGFPRAAAAC